MAEVEYWEEHTFFCLETGRVITITKSDAGNPVFNLFRGEEEFTSVPIYKKEDFEELWKLLNSFRSSEQK